MAKQRKRFIIYPTLGLLIAFICFWQAAGSFVSPDRRQIQAYHTPFLSDPGSHGISLSRHVFDNGQIPTLIARPHPTQEPHSAGKLLQSQLQAKGITTTPEQAIVVLLHGRMGRKEDMLPIAARYCAVGFICLMPDLPAHGDSPMQKVFYGSSPTEASLPERVLSEAKLTLSLPHLPASLWGMSMGGSFAIHAAAQNSDPWSSLTIICSFDEMNRVVENQLGWFAGIGKALVKLRGGPDIETIRPIDLAPQISLPTLIVHGNADSLIHIDQGRALHAAFPQTAPLMEVDGGTHSTVLITDAPVYSTTATHMLLASRKKS